MHIGEDIGGPCHLIGAFVDGGVESERLVGKRGKEDLNTDSPSVVFDGGGPIGRSNMCAKCQDNMGRIIADWLESGRKKRSRQTSHMNRGALCGPSG